MRQDHDLRPPALISSAGRFISDPTPEKRMAKEIPLPKGLFVLVDDEDFESMKQFKWRVQTKGKLQYAATGVGKLMHREIMQAPCGVMVDHINGDGLDNRRENLRLCTNAQNMMNIRKSEGRSSRFKGVSFHKKEGCWRASIQKNGISTHLGRYADEVAAARQYDRAARLMFGKFARTNELMGLI